MKEKKINEYFFENHLNNEAIGLCAEALILDKQKLLPESLQNHMEECIHCKKEVIAIFDILKTNKEILNIDTHPFFGNIRKEKVFNFNANIYKLLKYAAVVLSIIGISGLLYYFFNSYKSLNISKNQKFKTTESVAQSGHDSLTRNLSDKNTIPHNLVPLKNKLQVQRNEIAMNMRESSIFENLVASQYRSIDIAIISPALKQKFSAGMTIDFKFNGDISVPITLLIYNNTGNKILEKNNIFENNYKLENKLLPGLYYWKIKREDDLLFVGKFYVK